MLKKVLLNSKLPKPIVSYTLVFCCLAVSVPIFMYPQLRNVFSTRAPYPWWIITALFVHDDRVIPLYLHLIVNITVIFYFGTIIEKILGSVKIVIVAVTAFIVQIIISCTIDTYGDGASGIAWAFAPLLLPVICYEWRKNGNRAFKRMFFNISLVLYTIIWIVITIISYNMGMRATNIWHIAATITGIVFMLLFKQDIHRKILHIENNDYKFLKQEKHKKINKAILILPILILFIYCSLFLGIINSNVSHIVSISPSENIKEINSADGNIVIVFDEPMKKWVNSKTYTETEINDIEITYTWVNEEKFIIHFNRKIEESDIIKINLEFRDLNNMSVYYKFNI